MSVVGGGAEGDGGAADDVICIETDAAGAFLVEEQAARAAYALAKGKKDVAFQAFAKYTGAPDGKAVLDEKAYKDAMTVAKTAAAAKKACDQAEKGHRTQQGG